MEKNPVVKDTFNWCQGAWCARRKYIIRHDKK